MSTSVETNELMYQIARNIGEGLFKREIFTPEEYEEFCHLLIQEFHPYISELLTSYDLTL